MEKDSRDSHFTGGPTLSTTEFHFALPMKHFSPSNLQFYYLEAYLLKVISTNTNSRLFESK